MKFTIKNTRSNHTFSQSLQRVRCAAQNQNGAICGNVICIGLPYCHVHRKSAMGLQVKRSLIPNSGRGLFAAKLFHKGDVIGMYNGQILDGDDLTKRYGVLQNRHCPYVVAVGRGANMKIVDAACRRCVMSMANGSSSLSQSNARFVDHMQPNGAVTVRATRRVNRGDEIILHYGHEYFDSMWNVTHTTT